MLNCNFQKNKVREAVNLVEKNPNNFLTFEFIGMFVSCSHVQSPDKRLEKAKRISIVHCIFAKIFGNLLGLVMLGQSFSQFWTFWICSYPKGFEFCVHFMAEGWRMQYASPVINFQILEINFSRQESGGNMRGWIPSGWGLLGEGAPNYYQ